MEDLERTDLQEQKLANEETDKELDAFERYCYSYDEDEIKMFLLCDEYGRQYGGDDYSEVVLFKKPYKWKEVKEVMKKVIKEHDLDVDTSLYDAMWDALEENFEVEDSIVPYSTPYYIEW